MGVPPSEWVYVSLMSEIIAVVREEIQNKMPLCSDGQKRLKHNIFVSLSLSHLTQTHG